MVTSIGTGIGNIIFDMHLHPLNSLIILIQGKHDINKLLLKKIAHSYKSVIIVRKNIGQKF